MLHRISHRRIAPPPITPQTGVAQLLDDVYLSYNAGRLREACQLLVSKLLAEDCVVGLTLSGPRSARALELALAARVDGERVFDAVQATFNCLEPSLAGPLARAHEAGVGVIAKEVFANGRLTNANALPEDESLVRGLRAAAAARSCSIDQLALAFVLAHPFVDMALSGAVTTAQVASHSGALAVTLDDEARALLAAIAEPPERYWATRARLPWT